MCKCTYNFPQNCKYTNPDFNPQEILRVLLRNVPYNCVSLAGIDFPLNVSVMHNLKNFIPARWYAIYAL